MRVRGVRGGGYPITAPPPQAVGVPLAGGLCGAGGGGTPRPRGSRWRALSLLFHSGRETRGVNLGSAKKKKRGGAN